MREEKGKKLTKGEGRGARSALVVSEGLALQPLEFLLTFPEQSLLAMNELQEATDLLQLHMACYMVQTP